MSTSPRRRVVVTLSGEIHIKSRRTAGWFRRVLRGNLMAALARETSGATITDEGPWLTVDAEDLEVAAEVAARTFGVHRVELASHVHVDTLDGLTQAVAARARPRVRGRTFAVRVKRRGVHDWSSMDAQRTIGAALLDDSAGVDLDRPETEVVVQVFNEDAWVVDRTLPGPEGLPLGTQPSSLALLSGGFDSPVAAWLLMRRGSPMDFVHFKLDCAASDHATVVAHDLVRGWGAGAGSTLWMVDFQPVKQALFDTVPSRLRQVVLKQLMFRAADELAATIDAPALVTGESVGQVSSQTLAHLGEIDRMVDRTVLRPLAGATKHEIIDRARSIGTETLSARAKEVCDLSDGPVAINAGSASLDEARAGLPDDLVERALATREVVALDAWRPGHPLVPVVQRVPAGATLVWPRQTLPEGGPVVFGGEQAVQRASGLLGSGRDVMVLDDRVHLDDLVPAT